VQLRPFCAHSVNIGSLCMSAQPVANHITPAYECPGRDLNPYSTFVEGGFKPPASASFATRAGMRCPDYGPGHAAPRTAPPLSAASTLASTTLQSSLRNRSASGATSPFDTTMPSIMSASTAACGRPLTRTDTTEPVSRRRMVRSTPTRRGGQRNPGAVKLRRRVARESRRAACAKSTVEANSMIPS
jgi:hypothetical protein